MPYNFLLLPLLGGFLFISLSNRFKFAAMRGDGYRLLLQSSVAGVFLLSASLLLVFLFRDSITLIDQSWHKIVPYADSGVTALSFLLGLALGPLSNLRFRQDTEAQRAAEGNGDPLELLLRDAVATLAPVLLTVKNGKVYVGLVTLSSTPAVSIESITILPRMSGYRRTEDRRVHFTTDYRPLINAMLMADASMGDMRPKEIAIVIPMREIESAGLFSKQLYDEFFAKHIKPIPSLRRSPAIRSTVID
jgi:hypothetical protein